MPQSKEDVDTLVILAAAGQANRFRTSAAQFASQNKVFLELNGLEVWQHCVKAFRRFPSIGRIYMTVSSQEFAWVESKHKAYLDRQDIQLVIGGTQRWESIRNALERIEQDHPAYPAQHLVAVHDAARPCVSIQAIGEVLAAARTTGAAILGQPLWGTIKRVNNQKEILETVPRENLFQATTPQACRFDWLKAAYLPQNLELAGRSGAITDDAQLLASAGFPVILCPDSPSNIKITTADDLPFASMLLNNAGGSAAGSN